MSVLARTPTDTMSVVGASDRDVMFVHTHANRDTMSQPYNT